LVLIRERGVLSSTLFANLTTITYGQEKYRTERVCDLAICNTGETPIWIPSIDSSREL
jgi:hypothetical protein